MSEIKGQLLGVILTLAVFAAVFTVMKGTFSRMSTGISNQVDSALTSAGVQTGM